MLWQGDGWMVATVAVNGGDGLAWVAAGASAGGRGRNQRGGRCRGVVALLAPSSSSGGKQEVAACVLACGGHAPLPTGVR